MVGALRGLLLSGVIWVHTSALHVADARSELFQKYSFYHSSQDLIAQAQALEHSCEGLSLRFEGDSEALPVVHVEPIASDNGQQQAVMDVMMVFGVHPREIISPEAGLHFLQQLCQPENTPNRIATRFLIVLDANPEGRKAVEDGDYCRRTNEDDVDLNRNYGAHWAAMTSSGDGEQGNFTAPESFSSGSGPLSEPETQTIAKLLQDTKPTVFLDVHSGSRSLLMPNLWSSDQLQNVTDLNRMRDALQQVSNRNCPECVVGNTVDAMGYVAPGASADYAYSLGVPYSFLWEIYTTPQKEAEWSKRVSQVTTGSSTAVSLLSRSARQSRRDDPSSWLGPISGDLVVSELRTAAKDDVQDQCFSQFNPTTEQDYKQTLQTWTQAFFNICNIARKHQG